MSIDIDTRLFEQNPHNPSLFRLVQSSGCKPGHLMDFCVPCNPYFPTPEIYERLGERLRHLVTYYPSDIYEVSEAVAAAFDLESDRVVASNGSDELIAWIDELMMPGGVCTSVPTFNRWLDRPRAMGRPVWAHPMAEETGFAFDVDDFLRFVRESGAPAAVIVNPNNPTAGYIPEDAVEHVLEELRYLDLVVVDESFIDFVLEDRIPSCVGLVERFPNLLVVKSLGKNLGLHGVRLGYAISHPARVARLRKAMPRWSVNALGEAIVYELAAHMDAYEAARRRAVRDRHDFQRELETVPGVRVLPSFANFVTFQVPEDESGTAVRNQLLEEYGIYVRDCSNKEGIDGRFIRVACRRPEDNRALIETLNAMWGHYAVRPARGEERLRPPEVEGLDLRIDLPLEADWPRIELTREAIESTIRAGLGDSKAQSAIPMVVAELLENAIRHGRWESDGGGRIHLRLDGEESRASVQVANPAASTEHLRRLTGLIEELRRGGSPASVYSERIRAAFEGGPDAAAYLGIARVAYEGGAEIDCEVSDDGRVTVRVELEAQAAS